MMLRATIDRLTTKNSVIVIGVIGAGAVFYGILKDHSLIFIIGLILVLGGYLLMRRRIKESIRDKAS